MKKMDPVKKLNAGTVSCALWENEAMVAGKRKTSYRQSRP
jgi:hypothetical protein